MGYRLSGFLPNFAGGCRVFAAFSRILPHFIGFCRGERGEQKSVVDSLTGNGLGVRRGNEGLGEQHILHIEHILHDRHDC